MDLGAPEIEISRMEERVESGLDNYKMELK